MTSIIKGLIAMFGYVPGCEQAGPGYILSAPLAALTQTALFVDTVYSCAEVCILWSSFFGTKNNSGNLSDDSEYTEREPIRKIRVNMCLILDS